MSQHLPADVRGKLKVLCDDEPDSTLEIICTNLAAGGSLITLCETWGVSYWRMIRWVRTDTARAAAYNDALLDRDEWAKERILDELRVIATSDLREAFGEDGSLKPPNEWPHDMARAIQSVEVEQLFEGHGKEREQVGFTKKIRCWDKLKGLELIGKKLGLFVEKHEHTGNLTLEQLVSGSFEHTKGA